MNRKLRAALRIKSRMGFPEAHWIVSDGRQTVPPDSHCEKIFRLVTFLTFKNKLCKILRHRIYSLVSLCSWSRRESLVGRGRTH